MLSDSPSTIATSLLTDFDISLFQSGKHFRLYEKLGSRLTEIDGVAGVYFAVWAPNAREVSVIGDFNRWQGGRHQLYPRWDNSGIWEGFVPGLERGALYKYRIIAPDGRRLAKGDPFALYWETPPQTASVVWDSKYAWKDQDWMKKRQQNAGQPQAFSVYEVHLGSWRKKDRRQSPSYRELAETLVPYVADLGFTHVEFMPVMEHPYDPSWGYQITGYFAPTSRFGTPEDFMYLVDAFHRAGIGVLLDWVPSHFPTDAHGLADFDGTHLYDHEDPRQGFHPDWKSAIFNYGRHEVRAFLISNALFWLERYHIDGLRVDAVASMLYLDYSRDDGQWIPNQYGGNENLEAVDFLKEFNETVYREFPDAITIAEESTAWTGVSRPTYTGGLGFGQKWMMGWMHDTLKYFKEDPIHRKYHHNAITFSLVYAFTENFMLPLSHDEVVHGKGALIDRMPGDEWQRFANMRLLFGYMFTHPGSKLLYMGGEFAQTSEWSLERGLDWWLLPFQYHQGVQQWVKALNHFYTSHPSLYHHQFAPEGFEWVELHDGNNSVVIYLRKGEATDKPLLVICNFTPVVREEYQVGVPGGGQWKCVLNGDDASYGGSGYELPAKVKAERKTAQGRDHSLVLSLPPLAVTVWEPLRWSVPKQQVAKSAEQGKRKARGKQGKKEG
ncbi:MAG: 1,4-alpha-glucan branching protein GlgB [Bacteroidota bacterium]